MDVGFFCGICGGKFVKIGSDKTGTYWQCQGCGTVIKA